MLALVLPATGLISGCVNSWEQTTYVTLATGKALIDCAVAGYNHFDADIRQACAADSSDPAFDPSKFYIPQTRDAQQAIEKARQAQIACVEAFEGYAVAKLAKDKTISLADKQGAVEGYLAQLPALFDAVRALMQSRDPVIEGSRDRITKPTRENQAVWGRRDIRRSGDRLHFGLKETFAERLLLALLPKQRSLHSMQLAASDLDERQESGFRSPDHPGSPDRPVLAGWGGHSITGSPDSSEVSFVH